MSLLWGHLLERFNLSSKRLQSVDMDLVKIAEIYQSLVCYVNDLRTDSEYEYYKKLAIEKWGIEDFEVQRNEQRIEKHLLMMVQLQMIAMQLILKSPLIWLSWIEFRLSS
ncbi:unnamed protein product [Macrosiphum euphorbiae]|uniref:Uncharacterized protein n=1 Tax=Macrosiphum euphorbiae TaxID=13131 RepID=A0AAV0VJ20_9HEMI|nr:unnamed protein product [Macrosiphum euphorbiae]